MYIEQLWAVSTGLSQSIASSGGFLPALLVDHADVPVHARVITVNKSSYSTDLTAATDALSWCTSLWGQNYNPANAYICRWASAATEAGCVFYNAETDYSVFTALTNTAKFKLVEGASNEDISPDFTGDTSKVDNAASIQTALGSSTLGAAYTCIVDALGYFYIGSDNTGSSADAVSITTPSTGVDLSLAAYLGTSTAVAGLDIESLGAAQAAVKTKMELPYAWCQRGGSIAQVTAFSTVVNAMNNFLFLRCDDPVAKTATTTDFGYAIDALGHNRTHMCYTEHTVNIGAAADQNPDAVVLGEILARPNDEGATSYANTPLSGVSKSGLHPDGITVISLTDGERAFLEGKGYDYLIKPRTLTHLRHGLTPGGQEVRVMVGRDWFNMRIMEDVYSYVIAQRVVTYSDRHFAAIKGFLINRADTLVDRQCLEAGYTIDMPLASSFTATEKATHTLTLSNVLNATVQLAINDGVISMNWAV